MQTLEIIKLTEDLNNWDENTDYRVALVDEYLTLFIDDKMITQGESEVLSRLKQLKRELGIF